MRKKRGRSKQRKEVEESELPEERAEATPLDMTTRVAAEATATVSFA